MFSASAKIPAFLLVLMFLASVVAVPSNIALAQQTETAEEGKFKARADILLNILEKAKERVDKTLEKLEEKGVTIPEEAKTNYETGLSIAEEAVKLRDEGKYREACEKAVEAMRSFKNVLVAIHKAKPPIEAPKAEVEARKAIGLKVAVERAKIYADRLEKLIASAEDRGFKVPTEIKEKISKARSILDEALRLLDEGKVDEAARKLGDARKLLGEAMAEFRKTVAQQIKLKMTERFLNKTEERIEKLKERLLPLLEKLPEEKREKVEALIANATRHVEEAKEKARHGIREIPKIMPILREIAKTIHETRKEAGEKRLEKIGVLIEVRKLQAQTLRLEARIRLLERLGVDMADAKNMLNETRSLLNEAKNYIDQDNPDKAKEAVEKARELIAEIDKNTGEALGKAKEKVLGELKQKALKELEELQKKLDEIEAKIAEMKAENITVARFEQILAKAKDALEKARERVESGNFTTTCQVICPVKAVIYRLEKSLEWAEKTAKKIKERIEEVREKIRELEEEMSELEAKIAEAKEKGLDVSEAENRLEKARGFLIQARKLAEEGKTVLAMVKTRLCEALIKAAERAVEKAEERWIPYTPGSENVEVNIRQVAPILPGESPEVLVEVVIVFPHAGFRVDWDGIERDGKVFTVNVKVEEWTGPSIQVVTRKTHVYELGKLEPGIYTFTFKANGKILVIQQFEVKASSTPQLKPKIIDILKNPEAYRDKTIIISGEYCGWSYPKG
jgi:DNA repair exonuclease SbcCD ATPase subunit